VLDAYLAAGRGLAAAHAAGIIHRDFKPDNVLVSADGRARVTDFGLSRADWDDRGPDQGGDGGSPPVPAPSSWIGNGSSLTATGTLVGTPVYMAPEQLAGGAASARSDLFSFCIALYEGLYGERPFSGSTLDALRRSMREPVPPPPAGARVPPWIRRVLLRGLCADPDARYPSMETLLHTLSREPVQGRSWRAPLGAVLAGILGATAVLAFGLVSRPASRAATPPEATPHPAASASVAPTSTVGPPTAEVPGPQPVEQGSAPGPAGSSSPAARAWPAGKPVSPVKARDRGKAPVAREPSSAPRRADPSSSSEVEPDGIF
jgi:serine/threonine protein kinase